MLTQPPDRKCRCANAGSGARYRHMIWLIVVSWRGTHQFFSDR
jgi:hypothetical protein